MAYPIKRVIQKIDAAGQAPGRIASRAAHMLIGKHKVDFISHVDGGDFVEVINTDKMVVTGRKLEQKIYRHHTGYPGGLREKQMQHVLQEDPGEVLLRTVSCMLPKNSHRTARLHRLIIKK